MPQSAAAERWPQAVLDRPAAEPERDQLRMRHHSVLPVGELGEEAVRRGRSHFNSYVMFK